jgi:capsular polysaccharide biosynthesis protein
MSAVRPPADLGGEREIDLRRWLDVVLARRWFVIAGLIVGVIIGGLYSLSGASAYEASVTIQPAQPFSPAGQPVLNYSASPLAIQTIVNSTDALGYVARKARMPEGELRGHVSTASISTGTGPVTTRGTVLLQITVTSSQAKRAADAANAFGDYVVHETESTYVKESLSVYAQKDKFYNARLVSVNELIAGYEDVLARENPSKLDPFDRLLLFAQLNDAVARQGNLQDELITNQQAQTLAQTIEVAQIINPAAAAKVTSRSRRNSILFGGLIGVLVGGLVALVLGLRPGRPAAAK